MTNDTKEAFALNLILCRTVKEAAKQTGISLSTATRLKKQENFQKYLFELREKMYADTLKKMQALSSEAVDTLREIIGDASCTDSSRVAAARFVLEMGMEAYTKEKIVEEINMLKKTLEEGGC